MSTTQTTVRTLEDQFAYELEAVYDMELKLVDELEEMSRKASNDNLSSGFQTHLEETREHVQRVEDAFEALGREPSRRTNRVVEGLVEETSQFEQAVEGDELLDLHYLNAAMKTERIEMTAYEGLQTIAKKADIGDDVTDPLAANLDEEEKTFRKLEGLSKGSELKALWNKLTGN